MLPLETLLGFILFFAAESGADFPDAFLAVVLTSSLAVFLVFVLAKPRTPN